MDRRRCFYINEAQDIQTYGGYVPSLVVEGERGHTPLNGGGSAAAWVWGQDLAKQVCEATNRDTFGLESYEVNEIVLSSMVHREGGQG